MLRNAEAVPILRQYKKARVYEPSGADFCGGFQTKKGSRFVTQRYSFF